MGGIAEDGMMILMELFGAIGLRAQNELDLA